MTPSNGLARLDATLFAPIPFFPPFDHRRGEKEKIGSRELLSATFVRESRIVTKRGRERDMALRSIAPAPLFRERSRSGRVRPEVRELGRLRRPSTVEIHGRDIEEYDRGAQTLFRKITTFPVSLRGEEAEKEEAFSRSARSALDLLFSFFWLDLYRERICNAK